MDIAYLIRGFIFLMAGLAVLLKPDKVFQFQKYVLTKIPIQYNIEKEEKNYPTIGAMFIIISLILFVISITK